MKINLPTIINFYDYHEIDDFGDKLKAIVPGVKWLELDRALDWGKHYCAIFYKAKDDTYKKMLKKYKNDLKEFLKDDYE